VTHFRIPVNLKNLFIFIIIVLLWMAFSCTYEPLQPPELPKFYQTINLPLADVTLYLSGLHDTTNNIYGDSLSDSLYFKFEGSLDTVTLTEDIFVIPSATSVTFQQDFAEIDQANNPVSITIPQTIKFSTLFGLSLPQSEELTIDPVPRMPLIDQDYSYQIFSSDSIPYFERVDYLTIGEGNFTTSIENEMLIAMDSVIIRMKNRDGSLIAESFYETIPPGETRFSNSDLRGEQIMDQVIISISAILAGTNDQPLTIPANTDPYLTITIGVELEEIESFTGKPESIEIRVAQPLPKSKNTIFRGIIAETPTLNLDTNLISWRIENTLPINMDMDITFLNFYSETGALTIEALLYTDTVSDSSERLDLDTLRNPDPTTVVDSIIVVTTIDLLPDPGDTVTTIPLDFGGGMLDFAINISVIKFKEIEGFFNETFAIPPLTISDIPTGFGDVNFGEVLLIIHLFNEIQAQTELEFNIEGYKEGKKPEIITANETILKASAAEPVAESNLVIDIAPIFNLVPDSIMVFGEAAIPANDTSKLQVNKSFWGTYEIIVPFNMQINDMTFIPVKSNELSPMDEKTRQRIQDGFIEASIRSQVVNDFPLSGRVDVLISNYDYFPLSPDSIDSGYQWINDSLFAITDTGMINIVIDTLVTIELPAPVLDQANKVKIPGFVEHTSTLDSARVETIIGDEVHYIRPRIHLDRTDEFVSIGYNDKIDIITVLCLTMEAGALFGTDQDTTETDSLKKPIGFKKK